MRSLSPEHFTSKEKTRATQRRYYIAHKEKMALAGKVYRKINRERINSRNRNYYKTANGIFLMTKSRAKARNLEFGFTKDLFLSWYKSQPAQCHYCGIPAALSIATFGRRLSIDRTNNSCGYVPGNLALACFACNTIKNSWLSESEMLEIGDKYLRLKWQS